MPRFSAQRLREARKAAGLSREKVAVSAGVSISSIERYEQGGMQPGIETAARLADMLGVTVDALLDAAPRTVGAVA